MLNNKVAFSAQYGSANYNLMTLASDEDYITYYYPTFEDLYKRADWSKPSKVTEAVDNSWNDVRRLREGLIKSNPNTIEVLYSVKVSHNEDPIWNDLYGIREEITRVNLSHLFDASFGIFHNAMKLYKKKMDRGDEVKAKKDAANGFRVMQTIYDYYKKDYTDYASCLWYDEHIDKGARDHLLRMKQGLTSEKFIKEQMGQWYVMAEQLRPKFHSHYRHDDLVDYIDHIFEQNVKANLIEELGGH